MSPFNSESYWVNIQGLPWQEKLYNTWHEANQRHSNKSEHHVAYLSLFMIQPGPHCSHYLTEAFQVFSHIISLGFLLFQKLGGKWWIIMRLETICIFILNCTSAVNVTLTIIKKLSSLGRQSNPLHNKYNKKSMCKNYWGFYFTDAVLLFFTQMWKGH